MKLYHHPVSTTGRPVMLFAAENGAAFVALAELTGSDRAAYPNIRRWLGRMKALKSWKSVNAMIDGYSASLKSRPLVAV